jgi:hypothetical protein
LRCAAALVTKPDVFGLFSQSMRQRAAWQPP